MTDLPPDPLVPLPTVVRVDTAFSSRLPPQRVLDLIDKVDPEGGGFGGIAASQPFRVIAFRALLRDYPDRDPASLWLHAYDVEVEVADENPTNGKSPTPARGFADSGG